VSILPDLPRGPIGLALLAVLLCAVVGCGSSASTSTATTTTSGTRTLTANSTADTSASITTDYGATAYMYTRDTSACQTARTSLGLSGNWLEFSCNVVLGVTDINKNPISSFAFAVYVSVTVVDMPDYKSVYYPTTGTYSFTANDDTVAGNYFDLYSLYNTTFPDPGSIKQSSFTLYIPTVPTKATTTQTQSLGPVGVAVNGVLIFNNLAGNTGNIFEEAGSFDEEQGHPAMTTYHYHSEPYSISYNDDNLIGVMRDGFFIYGRKDSDGTDESVLNTIPTDDLYVYGGHVGPLPSEPSTTQFHYHLTQWAACYHRSGATVYSDDGYSGCTVITPSTGTLVTEYFMTGRGNGGTFFALPSAADNGGTMLASTPAIRYYYGTPGP